MTEWLFEYWYGKWVVDRESIRWRDTRWPAPFSRLSFFVSPPFYCREVSDRHKARRITAQRIQKDVNWSPPWGIQIHRLWRMAPSQIISLAPTANFVAYWVVSFLKSLPASIFITVPPWMSNSISAYRQITCPDPPCEPLFLCALIDMSPIPPETAALFRIWKQTLAGQTLPFLPLCSISFSHSVRPLSTRPFAIAPRNHPSKQWGNNRSSLSLGRSDCCSFHYHRDMTDCLQDGS